MAEMWTYSIFLLQFTCIIMAELLSRLLRVITGVLRPSGCETSIQHDLSFKSCDSVLHSEMLLGSVSCCN